MRILQYLVSCIVLLSVTAEHDDYSTTKNPDVATDLPSDVEDGGDAIQNYLGVSCEAGHRCVPVLECLPCDFGSYKQDEGSGLCDLCPAGCTTLRKGATSWKECVPKCPEGYEESEDGKTCTKCRAGYYKESWENVACTRCPNDDYDDSLLGMVSQDDCYKTSSTSWPGYSWTTEAPDDETMSVPYTHEPPSHSTMFSSDSWQPASSTSALSTGHTAHVYGNFTFTPQEELYGVDWDNLTVEDLGLGNDAAYYGIEWVAELFETSGIATVDFEEVQFTSHAGGNVSVWYLGMFYWTYSHEGFPNFLTERCVVEINSGGYGVYNNISSYVTVYPDSVYHGFYLDPDTFGGGECPTSKCSELEFSAEQCGASYCICQPGADWRAHLCPGGTVFSDAVGICDHMFNAVCPGK